MERKLERYHERVERVSKDITEAAWKRAQRKKKIETFQYDHSSEMEQPYD